MAFTAPRTWVAGEVVTAALMNTHVRDNIRYLYGSDGTITLTDGLNLGANELTINSLETVGVDGIVNKEQMEDHTHADAANCGTVDHGILTGLTDDDHTQYQKESLLTTAGDMVYATGDSAWARLAKGTAGQSLRMNVGETAPEWSSPAPTMQFFVPVNGAGDGGPLATTLWAGWQLDLAGEHSLVSFRLPADYATLTSVKIIIIPITTGTFDWTATTTFGANGEAYDTHTDTTTANGQVSTDEQLLELDISAAFDGIAANDIINLHFELDALDTTIRLWVLGLDVKYS